MRPEWLLQEIRWRLLPTCMSIQRVQKRKLIPYHTFSYFQIVWKNTARVGCGIAKMRRGEWNHVFIVCRYSPPGNFIGQYGENVLELK